MNTRSITERLGKNPAFISVIAWMVSLGPASATGPLRYYGSLEAPPQHFAVDRKAGLNVAFVAVAWSRFEPKPGVYDENYIKLLAAEKDQLRKLGYKLQVDFGAQLPPAWVNELSQGRYKNQFGDDFVSDQPGENLPNVVFNAEVRKHLAAFIGEFFTRLGNDWDFVRLGCSKYGELNYPRNQFKGRDNCYWAFDDLAQGKVPGLADGISPCPVPGWIPGRASADHADAKAFAEWYLNCLKNYQQWQIATVRRSFAGDICMLYGGWGMRPGWLEQAISVDLNGSTPCERNGEIQQGFDWPRMVGSITDPRVIVYCTWIDATIKNRGIADDNAADPSRWSPVHWQASLARTNPLHLRVWGENTGHNDRKAMQITFDRIRHFDLMGVMWAFDPELFANPNPDHYATLDDYSSFIRADSPDSAGR